MEFNHCSSQSHGVEPRAPGEAVTLARSHVADHGSCKVLTLQCTLRALPMCSLAVHAEFKVSTNFGLDLFCLTWASCSQALIELCKAYARPIFGNV